MSNIIAASLLACDFSRIGEEIKRAESSGADWLHFDVMDGHFVESISFGEPILESVRAHTKLPIDVHLMLTDPIKSVEHYAALGADRITVHAEIDGSVGDVLKKIASLEKFAALAVKPNTPISAVGPYLGLLDMILIMTVEPGRGGQPFLSHTLPKITEARKLVAASGRDIHIQVDGGINESTAPLVTEAGADVLVSGSYIFGADDMDAAVRSIRF